MKMIWADEPEMIEAKYQEIQELYPTGWFLSWTTDINFFNKTGIIWGEESLYFSFSYISYMMTMC